MSTRKIKVKTYLISIPTDQPFISQSLEVVSLEDYRNLLKDLLELKEKYRKGKNNARVKTHRLTHPRFFRAYNFWDGSSVAWESAELYLDQILNRKLE